MNDVVITDPDKIREFANALNQYSKQVDNAFSILGYELGKLSNSWRDQDFIEFAEYVKKSQATLKMFSGEVAKIVPKLEHDAEKMAAYNKLHIKL